MANTSPSKSPVAGGFVIALTVLAGTLIGAFKGQPTGGLLIGAGVGVVIAVAIWLSSRR